MMKNMRRGIPSLFQSGTTHLTGLEEAVIRNLRACKQLSDLTRTSLGPNGMKKMIINHLEKMFVTSDAATIMNEMEIDHPAAKMIVMASQMQEQEIGDGSNFVVCFAGELLGRAEKLIKMGLHPSEIITGYKLAAEKAIELFESQVVKTLTPQQLIDEDELKSAIYAAVAAKQLGYADILTNLVAKACRASMPENTYNFNVDNVRVARVLGGNIYQSEAVKGMVVNRNTEGLVKDLTDARIAVYTCPLQAAETETKQNVVLNSATQLLEYAQSEERDMEELIKSIADSGVNCIITGGTVDDMALHFCDKYKIMVIRITSKFELRRLCRTLKARALVSIGPVATEHQGYAARIYVRNIGAAKVIVLEQKDDVSRVATVVLRANTMNLLNDLGRAVDDGVNTIKACTKDGRLVCGAGAVDIEVAKQLSEYGLKVPGLSQYAIKEFAESFEVIPRILADNSGQTTLDIVSKLYAAHESEENGSYYGFDVAVNKIKNVNEENGKNTKKIYDLLATRTQAIKLAVDATLTVLSVDKIIQAKPAGGPRKPK